MSNQGYFKPEPNTLYKILTVLDGNKCLSIHTGLNKLAIQDYVNNAPNQQFHVYNNNGKYAFVNNNAAIRIINENKEDGASLQPDSAQFPSSYFEIVPVSQGEWAGKACYLKTFSGKVLDVKGGQPTANA